MVANMRPIPVQKLLLQKRASIGWYLIYKEADIDRVFLVS